MKKQMLISALIVLALIQILSSCSTKNDVPQVMCTEEFRTVSLTVTGDSLTSFYTVRESTSDTIRYQGYNLYSLSNTYPVLDDSYRSMIFNREERFTFIGLLNKAIVVNEPFVIGADECHIYKVSGKEEVIIGK